MAGLEHGHIVRCYGVLEQPDPSLFGVVLGFWAGGSLDIPRGGFEDSRAAWLAVQLQSAVEYMHARGVAHRDLKPDNILVDPSRSIPDAGDLSDDALVFLWVGIADFNQAKRAHDQLFGTQTGTLAYAAPEQWRPDGGSYDTKVDLFAVGLVVAEALAGYHPFMGDPDDSDGDDPDATELRGLMATGRFSAAFLQRMTFQDAALNWCKGLVVAEPSERRFSVWPSMDEAPNRRARQARGEASAQTP